MSVSDRMDSPLDYKTLWVRMRARLARIAASEAERAVTGKEMRDIFKAQGGYDMARRIQSEMDAMKDQEQGGTVIDDSDDPDANETQH